MKIGSLIVFLVATLVAQVDQSWLTWSASRAEAIGKAAYVQGRVGGIFDLRMLKTERAYNYKLAATWMTPEVIRASARTLQLAERLSEAEATALVADADSAGDTVVMIEIDPREGSGVIPADWSAFLQAQVPAGATSRAVRGVDTPKLRERKALAGVLRRNYDYDRFWIVFPLTHSDGTPLFTSGDMQAELVVRISGREGRVMWPIPSALKRAP